MTDHEGIVASVNPKLATKPEPTPLEQFERDSLVAGIILWTIVVLLVIAFGFYIAGETL